MKSLPLILLAAAIIFTEGCTMMKKDIESQAPAGYPHLLWHDEFNAKSLNTKKWSRIPKPGPNCSDWDRNTSTRKDLVSLKDGCLVLTGVANDDLEADPRPLLQGQVWTLGKFSFKYGKIEIRAKFEDQQGAWPAFWMLPVGEKWPDGGEIDIIERLNDDPFVYQTCHSKWTYTMKQDKNPPHGAKAPIHQGEFNVYGFEWTENELVWSVNGKDTFRYPRTDADPAQWPYCDNPFYILLDMQLEGAWVGKADRSTLPVNVWIDYVRVWTKEPGK